MCERERGGGGLMRISEPRSGKNKEEGEPNQARGKKTRHRPYGPPSSRPYPTRETQQTEEPIEIKKNGESPSHYFFFASM